MDRAPPGALRWLLRPVLAGPGSVVPGLAARPGGAAGGPAGGVAEVLVDRALPARFRADQRRAGQRLAGAQDARGLKSFLEEGGPDAIPAVNRWLGHFQSDGGMFF